MYAKRFYWLTRSNMNFRQFMTSHLRELDCSLTIQQAANKADLMQASKLPRRQDHSLAHHTDFGGYPLFYICADNSCLCPECASKQDREFQADPLDYYYGNASAEIQQAEINYEDCDLYCDACSKLIEPAYGDCQQADAQTSES